MRVLPFLLSFLSLSCSTKKSLLFDQTFNGDTVFMLSGQKFSLFLPSNPSTGYTWKIDSESSGFFSLESSIFMQNDRGLLGSGGREIFFFKSPEKNFSSLQMFYSRDWEENPPIDTFIIFFKSQMLY